MKKLTKSQFSPMHCTRVN